MNYNQNHKISQITSETLIVGVDIAKHNHVASHAKVGSTPRGSVFIYPAESQQ
ncbi:hypothetical protein [Peribacillus sp. NPDC056705]|uniref:hypothetical protein n=1 Tax=Peribacillus sp. NPDC056705 TaxID=3345918 RepID=UPI0037479D23